MMPSNSDGAPRSNSHADAPETRLYLNLLKKTLTDTLFNREPDADQESEARYVVAFIDHYMKGSAVSMLPLCRFDNLEHCIADVIASGVPGDFIEAGVWRGGATIFMRGMLAALGVTDRRVWVADSFAGLPTPDAEQFPIEAAAHGGSVMKNAYKHFAVDLAAVQSNFAAFDLLDDQVRFLKGWFKDTLPTAPIDRLAIMRLDGDYYESTMDSLTSLWDRLSVGGYAIIDDYGEDSWTYCRKAVDDFRRDRGIDDPMVQVDSKCFYWKRTR